MQQSGAQDRYRLRLHRARSVVLTNDELVEMRAAQRTFEGAYIRTALGQFSFSLWATNTVDSPVTIKLLTPGLELS